MLTNVAAPACKELVAAIVLVLKLASHLSMHARLTDSELSRSTLYVIVIAAMASCKWINIVDARLQIALQQTISAIL